MSVDIEWSKDHVLAICHYMLILSKAYVGMVNLRPDGVIRGKQRIVGWEGQGIIVES
jgi:hypothetical protein